jgi:heptosyltransferase-2
MKILIVAPAWVGDMVMAQTLFKLLQQQNPNAVIDVVAPPSTFALASRMPEIRQAFKLPVGHGGLQLKARYALGKSLRAEKYDQAFVLPNSWKSALVPFFAGIAKRTGWCGEFRYGLLNDVRILNKEKLPLMIQRFCALGLPAYTVLPEKLSWPVLSVDVYNQQKLHASFQLVKTNNVLALCPGAEYGPSKRWSPAYFAEVAKAHLAIGGQVWILGGPKDQTVADEIQQLCENACVNFVGKTSLPDAIDLLAMASAVVTNDSGLMHIAAAVNTPLVVIYGSTSPGFTPPLSERVKILSLKLTCSPCFERTCRFEHYHCLTELKPVQVVNAVQGLLSSASV